MSAGQKYPGHAAGRFVSRPRGVILHSSRSGIASRDTATEFVKTCEWAVSNRIEEGGEVYHLGWNATIGEAAYAVHLPATEWGWNAHEHSPLFLAVEFSQPTVNHPISDKQVDAFVAWYRREALPVWPGLDILAAGAMPAHSETAAGIRVGKSDPFPRGSVALEFLRRRIVAGLSVGDPADAALESYWLAHRARLGEKKIPGAGLLRRPWGGAKVAFYERGVLAYRDGAVVEITGNVIDDFRTYAQADDSLILYS